MLFIMAKLKIIDGDDSPAVNLYDRMRAWYPLAVGLIFAAFLALGVVLVHRIIDLTVQVRTLSSKIESKISAEELSRTRYESEIRELVNLRESQERNFHEIKVKLDYQRAVYEDDMRKGLFRKEVSQ